MFSRDRETLEKLVYTLGTCTSRWLLQEGTLAKSIWRPYFWKPVFQPPPSSIVESVFFHFALCCEHFPILFKMIEKLIDSSIVILMTWISSYLILKHASNFEHLIWIFLFLFAIKKEYYVHMEYIPRRWNCWNLKTSVTNGKWLFCLPSCWYKQEFPATVCSCQCSAGMYSTLLSGILCHVVVWIFLKLNPFSHSWFLPNNNFWKWNCRVWVEAQFQGIYHLTAKLCSGRCASFHSQHQSVGMLSLILVSTIYYNFTILCWFVRGECHCILFICTFLWLPG